MSHDDAHSDRTHESEAASETAHEDAVLRFVERFAAYVRDLRVGNGLEEGVDFKIIDRISGQPRNMLSPPAACPFQPRCRYEVEESSREVPPLVEIEPGHFVACHRAVRPA
jgi:ABC-type dipeptide/oligopeptide/nickel transport system ATPase component